MHSVEKWVTRSDAWTPEDDERLASIVLKHIRTGSTQLRAFEEASNELGRTAAACGYRWNGVLRKDRRSDIEAAKRERKAVQKSGTIPAQKKTDGGGTAIGVTTMTSSDSMKEVLLFLQTFDDQYQRLRSQVEELEKERVRLSARIRELETQTGKPLVAAEDSSITPKQLEEDSRTLFAIMERARKLLEADPAKARTE